MFSLAFNIGKGALIASGALGLGALCFYGMGLSDKPGAIEVSMLVFVVQGAGLINQQNF